MNRGNVGQQCISYTSWYSILIWFSINAISVQLSFSFWGIFVRFHRERTQFPFILHHFSCVEFRVGLRHIAVPSHIYHCSALLCFIIVVNNKSLLSEYTYNILEWVWSLVPFSFDVKWRWYNFKWLVKWAIYLNYHLTKIAWIKRYLLSNGVNQTNESFTKSMSIAIASKFNWFVADFEQFQLISIFYWYKNRIFE